MKQGDSVYTPRFCTVKIAAVYENKKDAAHDGYVEPTHFDDSRYDILGKHTGLNRMKFAVVKK